MRRNRLVSAFAKLNKSGGGRFATSENMHTKSELAAGPWRPRIFTLAPALISSNLERNFSDRLERCTAYWRFDKPAPKILALDFLWRFQ